MDDRLSAAIQDRISPEPTSGCWLWIGNRSKRRTHAYGIWGQTPAARRKWPGCQPRKLTHRLVYELLVGPIPSGLELDHLCNTPTCVNPSHLEPVTHRVNLRRGPGLMGRRSRQTACKWGHPFTDENTMWRNGNRRCRRCAIDSAGRRVRDRVKQREYHRAWVARKRAQQLAKGTH